MSARPTRGRQLLPSVNITRTTALFPSAVFIQWDVDCDESGSFAIEVHRAGAPEGPWECAGDGLRDAYNYVDKFFNLPPGERYNDIHSGLNLFSLSRQVYYKVVVTPPSGVENQFESPPVAIEPGLDRRTRLFKRKILRDEATAFRHLNGIQLVALKRKNWGVRCRDCWDPVTRDGTREHCRRCYGTTFEGGYWEPVAIRGRRTPGAVEAQMTPHGDSEVRYVNFLTLDYPHLEYKDLIIDVARNDRFIIQRAVSTELKTVTVHQTLTASLIARDAVEYKVPVDPATVPPLY